MTGGGRALEGKGDGTKGYPSYMTAATGKGKCEGVTETGGSPLAGDNGRGAERGEKARMKAKRAGREMKGDNADETEEAGGRRYGRRGHGRREMAMTMAATAREWRAAHAPGV